jgi:eukaryotic-like serine/threonine-protein kinase
VTDAGSRVRTLDLAVTDTLRMDTERQNEWIADEVADLAERVSRGETLEFGELEKRDPYAAGVVRRLVPAIRLLSELAEEDETEDHPPWFMRPPDVLGDFKLGRELGRGGIGVVYEATQISLGRRVAVKVLPPASLLDPRQMRRFEIEAQAAAALQHPNIVPVFAYGTAQGVPYFAMRLIEGRNLAELVMDRRAQNGRGLLPREVAELGRQAAEALDYAHRNEVLHRDIKPSNFLVDAFQRLWIADFGLARVRGDSDLTASGDILGTLRYLSPEQAKGSRAAIDGRSDIYSLGATLFELLTLRQMFEGVDRAALLLRIVSDEPRFSRKLDAAIPVDMKMIVLKALAKDPAERYATAGDLAGDLTLFLADQPIRARPPTLLHWVFKRVRRHWRGIAATVLVTVVILIGAVASELWANARLRTINERLAAEKDRADRHARAAEEQARKSERHAQGAQLRLAAQALDAHQPERAQEILRDAPLNADGEAPHSFVRRYLWRQARREIIVLVGPTPRHVGMALSADGKLLATSEGIAGLRLWDAGSGAWIRDVDTGTHPVDVPAFSPDSTVIAAAVMRRVDGAPDGFLVWDVATGRQLVRLPMDGGFSNLAFTFLPDGGFLGFGSRAKTVPHVSGLLWSLTGDRSPQRWLEQLEHAPNIDATSTGGGLLTHETPNEILLRDPRTGQPIRRFALPGDEVNVAACACSRGAECVAAVSEPGRKLKVWDGHTGKELASQAAPEHVIRLRFSPDGATLAAIDNRGDIHLIDRAHGAIRRICPENVDRSRYTNVAFSPDSAQLATSVYVPGTATGTVSIWRTSTGKRMATFPGRAEQVGKPEFTADSRSLLIMGKSGVRQWRLAPAVDDKDRQPSGHTDEAWSLAFSPDGRTLATGSDDDSGPDPTVKLWNTATGRLTMAWHGGHGTVAALAFSPDGLTLATGHLASTDNVRIWDVANGHLRATLKGHTDRVRAAAFARDGDSLATASSDGTVRLWDVRALRERVVLRGHADTVHAVAFSPDGNTLASAGNDGDLRLWDLRSKPASLSPPRVLHNRSNLLAVAFAPDGNTLAVADDMGSMTLWDLERFAAIRLIYSDGDELRQLAFTPDGSALAAAGIKGLIRLWDPATGQELLNLSAHRAQINGLAFSPDGSILGSVAHDGSVRLWRAEP